MKKRILLTTAAAAALIAATTSASLAFDKVTWDWTSSVTTDVNLDPINVTPTGLTQVEKAQVQIGNVGATASTGTAGTDPDVTGVEVHTSATAVGNNQNITSNTATLLNDGQFTYGSAKIDDPNINDLMSAAEALFDIDNSHLAFGLGVVAGEALDVISPASITATSTTTNVSASGANGVDNNATAVANNTNVNVDAGNAADNLLVGDLTQVAVANVSASASLTDVTASLGGVNNHATAVGNNVNINVGPVVP